MSEPTDIKVEHFARHPTVMIILGDLGSGKSVTAASFINEYHRDRIPVALMAPPDVHREWRKTNKWIKRTDYKRIDPPRNHVVLADDAHLMFPARRPFSDAAELITTFSTLSRQKNCTFIIVTQNSAFVDVNVTRLIGCIVIKKPTLMQLDEERPSVRYRLQRAERALKRFKVTNWDEWKRYAYVESRYLTSAIILSDIKPPKWWSDDISRAMSRHDWTGKRRINVRSFRLYPGY